MIYVIEDLKKDDVLIFSTTLLMKEEDKIKLQEDMEKVVGCKVLINHMMLFDVAIKK